MKGELCFNVPELRCGKCGLVIPAVDGTRRGLSWGIGLLACRNCAIEAAPPKEPKARRRRGAVPKEQGSFDAPMIFIS